MSLFQCLHYVSRSGLSFADSFNDEEHGKGSFEEQRFLASILALQVLNGIFKNCVSFPFTSCLLCSLNFRCMVWAKLLSEDWFLNMTFHKMFFRDKALSGSKISDWLPFIKEKTWGTRKKVIFDRNHDYSEETNFQKLRQEGAMLCYAVRLWSAPFAFPLMARSATFSPKSQAGLLSHPPPLVLWGDI